MLKTSPLFFVIQQFFSTFVQLIKFYVEITVNKCEGLVRARDIKDDYYTFDEQQYALVGQATGKMYQLGDEVMIRVKNTDLMKKQLDFELISE